MTGLSSANTFTHSGTNARETVPLGRKVADPHRAVGLYWFLFQRELALWASHGEKVRFWWRDDDAREPTPALDRLLASAAHFRAPLTLAVIPDSDRTPLARRLRHSAHITVIQHGVDHVSHVAPNERGDREFSTGSDVDDITRLIRHHWRRLQHLPGAIPVFAPPWNFIHPSLEDALLRADFVGLSGHGARSADHGFMPRLDTHCDLLRWKGFPHFRGVRRALRQLTRLCRERRIAGQWSEPIGILTHHLDMDDSAWRFLDQLLAITSTNSAAQWCALSDLLAGTKS